MNIMENEKKYYANVSLDLNNSSINKITFTEDFINRLKLEIKEDIISDLIPKIMETVNEKNFSLVKEIKEIWSSINNMRANGIYSTARLQTLTEDMDLILNKLSLPFEITVVK